MGCLVTAVRNILSSVLCHLGLSLSASISSSASPSASRSPLSTRTIAPVTFPKFSALPFEIRVKIWQNTIPPPRITSLRAHPYTLLPQLPRFPTPVLAILHTSHEARCETLTHYKVLCFPILVIHYTRQIYSATASYPTFRSTTWPSQRCGPQGKELERRWESRGCFSVNVRSDLVFFGRWATRDFVQMYGADFSAVVGFALAEVRFLAISMHSWRKTKRAWLSVLRGLEKLREVVFVRELLGHHSGFYHLLELEQVDVAVYEFSGELWRARILKDLKEENIKWPEWKLPRVKFKAIAGQYKGFEDNWACGEAWKD